MLITEGSGKIEMKIPAPYMPLSLLYKVRRFSDVLSSFVLLGVLHNNMLRSVQRST